MESIETLFQNQIKSSIELFTYHLGQIRQLSPHANVSNTYKMVLFKDPKGKLTPQGQMYTYGQFDMYGISRIFRSSNKTYPVELSKVKKFFEGSDLSKLVAIPVPFKSFLESCLLSSNAAYKDSVVMHPLFMSKLETVLNDRKIILTAGKFSAKSFIWNTDVQLITDLSAAVDDVVKEILDQEISLDMFIKIIQDNNDEYKELDYQFRILNQKLLSTVNYAEHTTLQLRAKNTDYLNQISLLKSEVQKLKQAGNGQTTITRPETKVTTSRALTWS